MFIPLAAILLAAILLLVILYFVFRPTQDTQEKASEFGKYHGYTEEVDGKGNSTYISQGILRASHRTPGHAPFENLGLPWYDHFESELQPVPAGEPFELVFDLLPTAYQFSEGNRIRITIAFADYGNFDTPVLDPAPTLRLLRNTSYPTYVELPVVQNP